MRLAFPSPASYLIPWPVTAGAARGIVDLRAIYGKVGGLVAGNQSGRSKILAMVDASRNPSYGLRDCIPWNYDIYNRGFTIPGRSCRGRYSSEVMPWRMASLTSAARSPTWSFCISRAR